MRPYLPIPREDLPKMIGKTIHLSWAHPGTHWELIRVDGDKILVMTWKTRRRLVANAADARYSRKEEARIERRKVRAAQRAEAQVKEGEGRR